MKKIGIMHGRERTFPEAFIAAVNARSEKDGVCAEELSLGAVKVGEPIGFDVIVDRISHEVPFYQLVLKQAALEGCRVINNPFWKLADDKFLGTALVAKLGVPVPKTVALPNREYVPDISSASLGNMKLVDWEGVVAYTGLPCFMKPAVGGGWKNVSRNTSVDELITNYNASGQLPMIVQEGITWEAYYRLIVIGKEHVYVNAWDPTKPHQERYTGANFPMPEKLVARMKDLAVKMCTALGYEMNTVEFAVRDGEPYAIDFMNCAPDFDAKSLTPEAFEWVVKTMADYTVKLATGKKKTKAPKPSAVGLVDA
jgi:glutathione synthase/RimK-type ligase-like ATP-grasp enzyme